MFSIDVDQCAPSMKAPEATWEPPAPRKTLEARVKDDATLEEQAEEGTDEHTTEAVASHVEDAAPRSLLDLSLDDYRKTQEKAGIKAKKNVLGLSKAGIRKGSPAKNIKVLKKASLAAKAKKNKGRAVGDAWERDGQYFTPSGKIFPVEDLLSFVNHMVKTFGEDSVPKNLRKQVAPVQQPAAQGRGKGGKGTKGGRDRGRRGLGITKAAHKGVAQKANKLKAANGSKGNAKGKGQSPQPEQQKKIPVLKRLSMSLDDMK